MNNQNNNQANNEGFLVYSRTKITQIASCLGNIDIKGVANIKNMSVVLALLEMPEKVLNADAFEEKSKNDE